MTTNKNDKRKQEILEHARQVFVKYGFERTTMDDIANTVGLKKGSLYYYYDSKEAMISDVINSEGKKLLDYTQKEIKGIEKARERVLKFVTARLNFFGQLYSLLKPTVRIILANRPTLYTYGKEIFEKEVKILTDIISDGIKAGEFVDSDSRQIAGVILNICDAVELRAYQQNDTFSMAEMDYSHIEEEVNFAVKLMLDGLSR